MTNNSTYIFTCSKISEAKLTAHKLSSWKKTSTPGGNFEKNVWDRIVYTKYIITLDLGQVGKKAKVSY